MNKRTLLVCRFRYYADRANCTIMHVVKIFVVSQSNLDPFQNFVLYIRYYYLHVAEHCTLKFNTFGIKLSPRKTQTSAKTNVVHTPA